jgi:hypothetical protein
MGNEMKTEPTSHATKFVEHTLYGYILFIKITKDYSQNEKPATRIEMALTRKPDDVNAIEITFFDVRQLELSEFDAFSASAIDITNISLDGLEGINFRVNDSETYTFSFLCNYYEFGNDVGKYMIDLFKTLL